MPPFDTLFLDLDDTLYPADSGVWEAVRDRIVSFIMQRLDLSEEPARQLRQRYTTRYGTTLAGLLRHHGVDAHEYMAYVHDIPLGEFLQPDPQLGALLAGLPQRVFIFTNADRAHAIRVAQALDIETAIDGVIGYFEQSPYNKPDPQSYLRALQHAGAADPARCVMVDDQVRNLEPAARLGMTIVLVGDGKPADFIPHRIARIDQLLEELPDLLTAPEGQDHDP